MKNTPIQIYRSSDVDDVLKLGEPSRRWHDDCACEVGNSTRLPTMRRSALASERPQLYPSLYQNDQVVAGYRAVFSPIAGRGVSLLDAAAATLLDLVDGQRRAEEIAAAMAAAGGVEVAATLAALGGLAEQFIVYLDDQPQQPQPQPTSQLGVWLHITNQCNLRCSYCYLGKTDEQMDLALGRRALRAVFQSARGQRIKHVILKYAGGEALLERETIWALNDYAQELATEEIELTSLILTNGTPISARLAEEMKRRGLRLAVSLDGLGASHDRSRPLRGGRPSFHLVERGLNRAIEHGLEVSVSVVVGPDNMAELPELIDYLLDRELPFTLNFLRDSEQARANLPGQEAALVTAMKGAYARVAARPPRFSLMNAALDRVQLEQPHLAACGIGDSYVVIKHTGEVSSCQMRLDRPIGHIREGDVLNMVQSRTPERPHGTTVDDHAGCQDCRWRYRCAGGCPVLTYNTFGRADTRSPFCGAYKALIPALIDIEARRIARYCLAQN
jgi:uncharacterized protein